ncbi:hypothetical protein [Parasitella parasitica]|uniref:Uncharacterized protein n=1 Tax=Parasitella parasitica TaxID=35722 RepID=A0A0B7N2P9_9FUNG|nr:hypothetical protein [Parasitella parasitica]
MHSLETLIGNHVGTNLEKRRFADTNEYRNFPFPTGVKRIYPTNGVFTNVILTDGHRNQINVPIQEWRERLQGLPMTDADFYANSHKYFPWLYHVASKACVARLPRCFRSVFGYHVCDAINLEQSHIRQFAGYDFAIKTQKCSPALDPIQRRRHNTDLLPQEKVAIDRFVEETRDLQQRFTQIDLTAIKRMIRVLGLRGTIPIEKTKKEICWDLFDMGCIGFIQEGHLYGTLLSNKRFENVICTDGVALEFICSQPRRESQASLTPSQIAARINLEGVASDTIKSAKHDHNNAAAREIISSMPSSKTSNLNR